jgi:hypothetical protein
MLFQKSWRRKGNRDSIALLQAGCGGSPKRMMTQKYRWHENNALSPLQQNELEDCEGLNSFNS